MARAERVTAQSRRLTLPLFMNTEHTKGPWNTNTDGWVIGPNGETIVSHHSMTYLDDTAMADARLIASAPELLAALESILSLAKAGVIHRNETGKPQWSLTGELQTIARAAIARATGR